MKLPVAPAASNLHECCSPHGIERRLRRYERIQEVLNSWPQNTRNSLVIRHACGPYNDKDLDISFVPLSKTPSTVTLQLHHCSRPGKWHKRWVTLLCDGQILSSKKADFSPAEKDCQVLCDLSCYDMYTPMDEPAILLDEGRFSKSPQLSPIQSLNPPKRWVLAVKSQERPTTALENINYVHFFCTDDLAIANKFQTSVHVWRSWYIVKTRGDALHKRDTGVEMTSPTRITPIQEKTIKGTIPVSISSDHVLTVSIGDFQPLMNLEHEIDEFSKNWVPELPLILPPMTPGTTSDISMTMTPSTGRGSGTGQDSMDLSSPSEQRRQRRDLKRSLTSIGAVEQQDGLTEGSGTATIIITEPAPQTPLRNPYGTTANLASPRSSANLEPTPWLPSAAEHTAKLRAEHTRLEHRGTPPVTPQRPATSTGIVRGGCRESMYVGSPPNMDRRPVARFSDTNNNNNTEAQQQQQQQQPPLPHFTNYLDWAGPAPPLPARAPGSGIYFSLNAPRGASSRHLEVPATTTGGGGGGGGKRRNLVTMPSMPTLAESGSPRKQRGAPGVPALWREGDDNHENNSGSSSNSSGRPSTSSNGSGGSGDASVRQLKKGRSGSMMSLRRAAAGRPFLEAPPPPIPPLPLHVRPAFREGPSTRPLGMVFTDARRKPVETGR